MHTQTCTHTHTHTSREVEEEANDVRKVGHMGNFYSNLLTKNVALGTAAAPAKPKEVNTTAGCKVERHEVRVYFNMY